MALRSLDCFHPPPRQQQSQSPRPANLIFVVTLVAADDVGRLSSARWIGG